MALAILAVVTASVASLLVITAASLILAVSTALSAKSPTIIVPSKILAVVTASVASLLATTLASAIMAVRTLLVPMVVASPPAELVTSPLKAGNLAAANIPEALAELKSTGLAVMVCPEMLK